MKLVIDTKVCLKNKLSPQEVLVAIAIRSSKDSLKSIVDNLLKDKLLLLPVKQIKNDNDLLSVIKTKEYHKVGKYLIVVF